jgi:hypothetical protein
MPNAHDLIQLIQQATAELSAEYRRIQAHTAEDPGTAGDEGEGNWAQLIERWLPAGLHVRTKGRIISSDGSMSPQIDVVVLNSSYPVGLLNKKIYLAAGVVAAFECKNTLRREHLQKAARTSAVLGKVARSDKDAARHIIYGVLAHSHRLASIRRRPEEVLSEALNKAVETEISNPRDCIDMVCVADLGTWTLLRAPWQSPDESAKAIVTTTYMGPLIDMSSSLATHGPGTDPIGRFLTTLLRRLGPTDPAIASLAEYFHETGLTGTGQGAMREWKLDAPPDPQTLVW